VDLVEGAKAEAELVVEVEVMEVHSWRFAPHHLDLVEGAEDGAKAAELVVEVMEAHSRRIAPDHLHFQRRLWGKEQW
jgi:hypothetical protein